MSSWLLVFVPVALFFIVSGFGFVGCVLDSSGLGEGEPPPDKPFTKYSDTDVIPTAIAYWPLGEPAATLNMHPAVAKDVVGGHDGKYINKDNFLETFPNTALFPCPGFALQPGTNSAPATGDQVLGAPGMLPGNAVQPQNDPAVLTTAMFVEGGFVTVSASGAINPPVFSAECWVRPEWKADSPAIRIFLDSRDAGGEPAGFALWVNQANEWEAWFGVGADGFFQVNGGAAVLTVTAHVVLTFDGTNAAIFINGTKTSPATSVPGVAKFKPNTTADLVIGVGGPWLPDRLQFSDQLAFPVFPFLGTIQDVAIYDTVLSDDDILKHFNDGSGKTTVPAG